MLQLAKPIVFVIVWSSIKELTSLLLTKKNTNVFSVNVNVMMKLGTVFFIAVTAKGVWIGIKGVMKLRNSIDRLAAWREFNVYALVGCFKCWG